MSLWQIRRKKCPHCGKLYTRGYVKRHAERCEQNNEKVKTE